ncbi:MAG: M24 family metallopeptidase [Endomicrobium sp.]|jgi:Xaa-Pro aminopeptidase|nr:M24 family metallopeptidase [Endomicrobium sp.]
MIALNKLNLLFEKYHTDSILFTNEKEIYYLTNFEFPEFWILATKHNDIYLLCSKMIENQVKKFFSENKYNMYLLTNNPYENISNILHTNKIYSLLVDTENITANNFMRLENSLINNAIHIIKGVGILNDIRLSKNNNEISNIKSACKITTEICNVVKNELKIGLSELDIYYMIIELFAKKKVLCSFRPIVASGENSANPHHKSSNRKIKNNDVIVLDIGCIYKNYHSDLTRTYFLGNPNAEFMKIKSIIQETISIVTNNIKIGSSISYVSKIAKKFISFKGYEKNFIHSLGHGIGLEIHEAPFLLCSDSKNIFKENSTFTIEPGIYIKNNFGVRIEDTLLLTVNGLKNLTEKALY